MTAPALRPDEENAILLALDKHGARLPLHPYRDAVIEVFQAGIALEGLRIADWLQCNTAEICDWSPPTIAAAIIDQEYLK